MTAIHPLFYAGFLLSVYFGYFQRTAHSVNINLNIFLASCLIRCSLPTVPENDITKFIWPEKRIQTAPKQASVWSTVALSGLQWHCLDYSGTVWSTVALSGLQWHCLVYSGNAWSPVALSDPQWHCLVYSGTVWSAVALSGPQWHCPVHLSDILAYDVMLP